MVARKSWAVNQLSDGTGVVTVEDARYAAGAAFTPAGPITSRTGMLPASATPGAVTATAPTPDGLVHVAPFRAVLQSDRGGGTYTLCLDAVEDVDVLGTAPADASNPRHDLIVFQQHDTYFGDADSDLVVRHITGTASATPTDPDVDGSTDYVIAARIVVPAGAQVITQDDIESLDLPWTVAVGGQLPVRSLAERNAIAPHDGQRIYRVDTGWEEVYAVGAWRVPSIPLVADLAEITDPAVGMLVHFTGDFTVRRWTGTEWLVVQYTAEGGHARYYETVSHTMFNAADTRVPFDTAGETTPDVTVSDGGRVFTLNRAGVWQIETSMRLASSTGARLLSIKDTNDGAKRWAQDGQNGGAGYESMACSATMRLPAGQTISTIVFQVTSDSTNVDSRPLDESNHISLTWLRP